MASKKTKGTVLKKVEKAVYGDSQWVILASGWAYSRFVERPTLYSIDMMRRFMQYETSGGVTLIFASCVAIIVANSPLAEGYNHFLHLPVSIGVGAVGLEKELKHFVNDGLMAIFFLLVGMEIKREFVEGELSSLKKAMLPLIAAVAGMAVPALVYTLFNYGDPVAMRGWAIPAATDIAFAIGIIALVGNRAPFGLKVLLVAIAVIDDLGAIAVIALFYTSELSLSALLAAAVLVGIQYRMNRLGVLSPFPYILTGIVMWIWVLQSGIHATLAGVFTAFAIPLRARNQYGESPLIGMEKALEPWVAFAVLPIFGYVNAGLSFESLGSFSALLNPVVLGITLGLLLGKQLGIFTAIWVVVKLRLCDLPKGADWPHIYAMSIICGIGFTISLFIGELAFEDGEMQSVVRLGVFTGSLIAAAMGYGLMRILPMPKEGLEGGSAHSHSGHHHRQTESARV